LDYDSEDLFATTRMSFGDHIEVLRSHLWRALAGFVGCLFLVFIVDTIGYLTDTPIGIGRPATLFVQVPVEQELQKFYDRRAEQFARKMAADPDSLPGADEIKEVALGLEVRELASELAPLFGLPRPIPASGEDEKQYVTFHGRIPPVGWTIALSEAERRLGRRPSLKTFNLAEGMMVYFKVSLICGFLLGSPWVFWQLWLFVATGLYPHEKRKVHIYLPFSLGLFLSGVAVCQFLVMPKAVEALLWFNEWFSWEPELRLSDWLGFALMMPLVFGLSFQTPLVMLFAERLRLLSVEVYRRKRRLAWFVMAIFAAVITPSTDSISMLLLWVPMSLLYELGILLCRISRSENHRDAEAQMAHRE
jgi:sec-independent protein translocase protein TatC